MASIYTTILDLFRAVSKNDGNTDALNVTGTVTTMPGTGAATSAKQDTGNTSLASIDGKILAQPSTTTVNQVTSSATVVTLLLANSSRKGAYIYNDSTSALTIKLGSTASTTSKTLIMAAASYYELPQPAYTGIITGVWASANGNAYTTES